MIEALKPLVTFTLKVSKLTKSWINIKYFVEPQWRFETRLPATLEGDEGDKIELECSVQDEDAECEWYFAGEVSSINPTSYFQSLLFPIENPAWAKSWKIRSNIIRESS